MADLIYDIPLRFSATVFVDAESVANDFGEAQEIMTAVGLKGFVPFPTLQQSSDKITSRVSFTNIDKNSQLLLLKDRFDFITLSTTPKGENIPSFEDFCKEAYPILSETLEYFGRKGHRLASVQEGLFPQLSPEKVDAILKKLISLPKQFRQNLPFEWDWRVTSEIQREFGDLKENTNTIAYLRRQGGTFQDGSRFDRIRAIFDINTSPKETKARFGSEELKSFFINAYKWHKEIADEINSFLELDE